MINSKQDFDNFMDVLECLEGEIGSKYIFKEHTHLKLQYYYKIINMSIDNHFVYGLFESKMNRE